MVRHFLAALFIVLLCPARVFCNPAEELIARVLPDRASAVGHSLAEIKLDGLVEVTGVRRRGSRSQQPGPDWLFEAGDLVVLLGRPEQLALAEQRLLRAKITTPKP